MNKLWIFGDSFSSSFNLKNSHENVIEYLKIIQKTEFRHWPELLSEKLEYELINYAKGGNSNYQIFQDFCDNCHLMNENDIVIIGWGLIQKFRISQNNKFINIDPNSTKDYEGVSNETVQSILKNRKNYHITKNNLKRDRWAWEVYLWENAIDIHSKNKKYNVFFWSTEEPRLIYCESDECKSKKNYLCSNSKEPLLTYLKQKGCLSMSDETENQVSDSHFGILGHELQAEIFYKEITKKLI